MFDLPALAIGVMRRKHIFEEPDPAPVRSFMLYFGPRLFEGPSENQLDIPHPMRRQLDMPNIRRRMNIPRLKIVLF